jgi:hypothetical protein
MQKGQSFRRLWRIQRPIFLLMDARCVDSGRYGTKRKAGHSMLSYCCRVLRYFIVTSVVSPHMAERENKIAAKAVDRRCALRSSRLARKQNIDQKRSYSKWATRTTPILVATVTSRYIISRSSAMSPRPKAYPRATLKKILKGHTNRNIGRGVDHLV